MATPEFDGFADTLNPDLRYYGLDAASSSVLNLAMNTVIMAIAVGCRDEESKINGWCLYLNAIGLSGGKRSYPSIRSLGCMSVGDSLSKWGHGYFHEQE